MTDTDARLICQGGGPGFWPCPDRAPAAVMITTPTGARITCCDLCGRAIYDQAPSEYQVDPLFMYADPYDDARMAAGLPPAGLPQQAAAPAAQQAQWQQQAAFQGQQPQGLLGRFLAWRRTPDGQIGETIALGALAWELHERHKRADARLTSSVMGQTMPDGVTPRHPHGYGSA